MGEVKVIMKKNKTLMGRYAALALAAVLSIGTADAQQTLKLAKQTLPNPDNPVTTYLARERRNLAKARGISEDENRELFTKQLAVLKANKLVPEKPLSKYDMKEAELLINLMYVKFNPTGTELLKDDGKIA